MGFWCRVLGVGGGGGGGAAGGGGAVHAEKRGKVEKGEKGGVLARGRYCMYVYGLLRSVAAEVCREGGGCVLVVGGSKKAIDDRQC